MGPDPPFVEGFLTGMEVTSCFTWVVTCARQDRAGSNGLSGVPASSRSISSVIKALASDSVMPRGRGRDAGTTPLVLP